MEYIHFIKKINEQIVQIENLTMELDLNKEYLSKITYDLDRTCIRLRKINSLPGEILENHTSNIEEYLNGITKEMNKLGSQTYFLNHNLTLIDRNPSLINEITYSKSHWSDLKEV